MTTLERHPPVASSSEFLRILAVPSTVLKRQEGRLHASSVGARQQYSAPYPSIATSLNLHRRPLVCSLPLRHRGFVCTRAQPNPFLVQSIIPSSSCSSQSHHCRVYIAGPGWPSSSHALFVSQETRVCRNMDGRRRREIATKTRAPDRKLVAHRADRRPLIRSSAVTGADCGDKRIRVHPCGLQLNGTRGEAAAAPRVG